MRMPSPCPRNAAVRIIHTMAGRARHRELISALTRRAHETIDPLATPIDYALDYVAGKGSLSRLARELEEELHIGEVTRSQVEKAVLEGHDPDEGRERLRNARLIGAHALAEQSLELADLVSSDKDAIKRAELQGRTRQWLAARWHPAEYGEQRQPINLNVSLNSIHLDLLRSRNAESAVEDAAALGLLATVPALVDDPIREPTGS